MRKKKLTKVGLSEIGKMTYKQALNFGKKNMPGDLKKAGFNVEIFIATCEINGWDGYRINYCK